MVVKIINQSDNALPQYETTGSAGMDLRAHLAEAIVLAPMERRLVPTGLFIELPEGYEAQVRPRSGLSIKKGLTLVNAIGTVDTDYRGEIKIPIINLSTTEQEIQPGERIAQMVFARFDQATLVETLELGATNRGSGGFGSTGVQ